MFLCKMIQQNTKNADFLTQSSKENDGGLLPEPSNLKVLHQISSGSQNCITAGEQLKLELQSNVDPKFPSSAAATSFCHVRHVWHGPP